jgi:ankyrin repeat protein
MRKSFIFLIITFFSISIVYYSKSYLFSRQIISIIDSGNISALKLRVQQNPLLGDVRIPPRGDTILNYSIENGNYECVTLLLDGGADVNTVGYAGRMPIHVAILNRNIEIAQKLVDAKANIDAKGYRHEEAPIHIAASRGWLREIGFLVINGANIESRNLNGETPLILAAKNNRLKVYQLLLQLGADPEIPDLRGRTAQSYLEKESEKGETGQPAHQSF